MPLAKLTKKLRARYWHQLTHSWLRNLPEIDPPGSTPEPLLNNQDLEYLCSEAKPQGSQNVSSARAAVPGLRNSICHESIYWLHKSVHSLGAAERKIQDGVLTWSIIDAYQSAYFSMRSLCGILGVVICDYQYKSYVVDICRDFGSMRRSERELESAFAEEVSVYTLGVRFDHIQCWQIFQRLLRVLKNETWGKEYSLQIMALDTTDFAHHRNRICYYAHEWLEEDLHTPILKSDFALRAGEIDSLESYKATSYFSVSLAYTLARIALSAYWDLAELGTILTEETKLLRGSLDELRHPYYGEQLTSLIMQDSS